MHQLQDFGNIWFDKFKYDEAERRYYLWLQKKQYNIDVEAKPVPQSSARSAATTGSSTGVGASSVTSSSLTNGGTIASKVQQPSSVLQQGSLSAQIAATRQQIKESLAVSSINESSVGSFPPSFPPLIGSSGRSTDDGHLFPTSMVAAITSKVQEQQQQQFNTGRQESVLTSDFSSMSGYFQQSGDASLKSTKMASNGARSNSGRPAASRHTTLATAAGYRTSSPATGGAVGGSAAQPLPTNAKKKRRNRNRSRRKRSKSTRASSCCQSVSPGRLSVLSNSSLLSQAQPVGDVMATSQQFEELKKTVDYLADAIKRVELRISAFEESRNCGAPSAKQTSKSSGSTVAPAVSGAPAKTADDDDGDIDLFGSDDDEAADAARQERLNMYAEKKAKKPAVIAKSSVVLDVKPWDDETDMKKMEALVRSVTMDGLLWGTSRLLPVGYGINKLQIVCVVEDDKVSICELVDKIGEFEDLVQSVDVAAFNKI